MKNFKTATLTREQHGMIQQALALHQAGHFDEARTRYLQLLRIPL